jgi:hypothetical protein
VATVATCPNEVAMRLHLELRDHVVETEKFDLRLSHLFRLFSLYKFVSQ